MLNSTPARLAPQMRQSFPVLNVLCALQALACCAFFGYWIFVSEYISTGDPVEVMPHGYYNPGICATLWLGGFTLIAPFLLFFLDLAIFRKIHLKSIGWCVLAGLAGWLLIALYWPEVDWLLD